MKLALDAGHGIYTSGKRCLKSIDSNETREWSLNSRVCEYVETILKDYEDVEIIRTDDITGETDISLSERCNIANNVDADIFISVHHNAGIYGGSGGGTAVYHYNNSENALTAKELYNAIVEQTNLTGNRASPVSSADFYVISYTNMQAYLIENGFMDSTTDVPIILTASHAKKTAQGIVDFLVNQYSLTKKETTDTDDKVETTDILYRVQVGAYSVKDNAILCENELIEKGYATFLVMIDNLYKVQVGAFSVKENAENMAKQLEKDGFDTFITTSSGEAVVTEPLKSIDEIAKEVIEGLWGNGSERKEKLTNAGYNFEVIQSRVNELLR